MQQPPHHPNFSHTHHSNFSDNAAIPVPELMLCGGRVQRVLQLSLESFQLLAKVSAVFLSLGPGRPLQLQVLLQLRDLGLQLADLLLSLVLGRRLFLDPGRVSAKCMNITTWFVKTNPSRRTPL